MALSSDEKKAFTVSKDGSILMWELGTMRKTRLFRPGDDLQWCSTMPGFEHRCWQLAVSLCRPLGSLMPCVYILVRWYDDNIKKAKSCRSTMLSVYRMVRWCDAIRKVKSYFMPTMVPMMVLSV